jgi:hypothetical protein
VSDADRFARAIAAIDAANADDPNRIVVRGEERPKELAHAELVTEWVERLTPEPSEPLLLAARAHHLRRWTTPRSSAPTGRAGYLKWRKELHEQHAQDVAAILEPLGYDDGTIERVQDIVRKRKLGTDPEVQVLEDALCLVFIETQLRELAARTDDEKMVTIIQKTAKKMSGAAIALVGDLELEPRDQALIDRALIERALGA